MTGDEVKAYLYLLCESWLECPRATLPNEDEDLAKMAQLSQEKWIKMKDKIMANFVLNNEGRLVNDKLFGVSETQYQFKKWGKMGGNPNIGKNQESEPKRVNPMVNPRVKGGVNPLVNLASASASASASDTNNTTKPENPKIPREYLETKVPENIRTERFCNLWRQWIIYRKKQKRSGDWNLLFRMHISKLQIIGEPRASASLELSIANGWMDPYELNRSSYKGKIVIPKPAVRQPTIKEMEEKGLI